MNKLAQLVTKLQAAREEMRKEGKIALKEAFSEFFDAHPAARAIVWTQYTPYFNDGDACTFSIHDFELHADVSAFDEDVQKYVKDGATDRDDEEEDDPYNVSYGYGDSDVAAILESIEDTEHNRQYSYRKRKLRQLTPEEKKLVTDFKALEENYRSLQDLAQEVIGDHVKVVVTRAGIRTSEYEHD